MAGILGDDFDCVSPNTIPDSILQALAFHFPPLGYLEKELLPFVDVTDKPEVIIELKGNNQFITDSEDKKARKKIEHIIKKKSSVIIFMLL